MADKELFVKINIEGASQEATELAKIELELKKLTKERNDYLKLLQEVEKVGGKLTKAQLAELAAMNTAVQKQSATYREHKKVVDTAGDSLTRMRAELGRMKKEAADGSQEVNTRLTPSIKKLTDEISKAEQAQGTFTRNVGNYGSAFGEVGAKMTAMLGPAALVAAAVGLATKLFNGMKGAIMSTTFAIDLMNQSAEVSRQLFFDLATTGKINVQNLKDANEAAKEFNRLRIEQYDVDYKLGKIQREINALMLEATDVSKSDSERLAIYTKVRELDTIQTVKETDAIKARLLATQELLDLRPGNENLIKELYSLGTQLDAAYAKSDQAMRRVESQSSAIVKRANMEREASHKAWMTEIDAETEALTKQAEEQKKVAEEKLKAEIKAAADLEKLKEDNAKNAPKRIESAEAESLNILRNYTGLTIEEITRRNEAIEELEMQHQESKFRIAESTTNLINGLAGKNKSLLKASLIADKALAIATVIIQTKKANAATRAWGAIGGPIGMILAEGSIIKNNIAAGINIAAITAATIAGIAGFKTGGKINRGTPINTGTVDDTLIAVNKTETVLTAKHVSMLGGSGVMRQIGVPGYAQGGYIGQQAPVLPSVGYDFESMVDAIRGIQIRLDINKVNAAQQELDIVTQTQRI